MNMYNIVCIVEHENGFRNMRSGTIEADTISGAVTEFLADGVPNYAQENMIDNAIIKIRSIHD